MSKLIRQLRLDSSEERGSALLVSLMVIVGLSLLGLGYVAISETESSISVNERNYSQSVNVAEAGAKAVVEMFQSPTWAQSHGLLPPNDSAFKRDRWITKSGTLSNIGAYRSSSADLLFDRRFDVEDGRFYGNDSNPDVLIDRSTSAGADYLDQLNDVLFAGTDSAGEVSEIRVFAPPIVGGTVNGNGFWDGGVRYGLATIEVTAQKHDSRDNLLAQRQVKMIISEWPFPGPQGPIQSNANISTGGNFSVHWGKMTAKLDIDFTNYLTSLPWFDASERVYLEYGYDSSEQWAANTAFPSGAVVRPSDSAIAGDANLKKFGYTSSGGTTGASEPTWPTTLGATVTDAGVTWTARWAPTFKNSDPATAAGTDRYRAYNWLYELVGKQWDDPWMEVRARGDITDITGTTAQTYKYSDPAQNENSSGVAGYSSWFQMQDHTASPDFLEVIFPRMDYDFWKDIAVTGNGTTSGVYYLTWVSGEDFTDGVTTQSFADWTNVNGSGQPGFYFFDTRNKLNPQGTGAPGLLTPEIVVNGSDSHDYSAKGFFYINAENFKSKGISPPNQWVNTPGEPYRDIGYREVIESGAGIGDWDWDGSDFAMAGQNSGDWSFQDLAWSNGDSSKNGEFDVFMAQRTITKPGDATVATVWLPVPYTPGCIPGNNSCGTCNCSEPHEPYLNLIYNSTAGLTGPGPTPFTAGWQDPSSVSRLPKVVTNAGNPSVSASDCSSQPLECTSNGFDRDGALVDDLDPMIYGVMYLEGSFEETTGNAVYYGSLLVQGNVGKAGTASVWFDESLIKGQWPPASFNFPRVFVSAVRTDE